VPKQALDIIEGKECGGAASGQILKALTIAVRAFKVRLTSDLTLMNLLNCYCNLCCF